MTAYATEGQVLELTTADLFASDPDAPIYTLTLYPSPEFYDAYTTRNPVLATIGSVCTILLMALFFFVYDSTVRKEFLAKKDLLEAKRRFMRFVSHEVRTPLK